VAVASAGPCKCARRSRQITTPAPHHSVFLQARCPSCRPTNKFALKAKKEKEKKKERKAFKMPKKQYSYKLHKNVIETFTGWAKK